MAMQEKNFLNDPTARAVARKEKQVSEDDKAVELFTFAISPLLKDFNEKKMQRFGQVMQTHNKKMGIEP